MRRETAQILGWMGFVLDRDFIAVQESPTKVDLVWRSAAPQPTDQEIEAAFPAWQAAMEAEAAARKTTDDQQSAGATEAKRAYTRMQTIIEGADTATTVQLRGAIKEIATTIQHLIRAAVK